MTSVLVGGALVTAALTSVRAGTVPAPAAVAGLALLALGVGLVALTTAGRRRPLPGTGSTGEAAA